MTVLLRGLLACVLAVAAVPAQDRGRLVVLGYDGLDFNTVDKLAAAGELPNFVRLRERGTLRALATTNPAQSPVSWAAMTTGMNPGKTGIDGFLRRDFSDGDVRARMALVERTIDRTGWKDRGRRRLPLLGMTLLFALAAVINLVRRRMGFAFAAGVLALLTGGLWYVSETQWPDGFPAPRNLRHQPAWWETLDAAGVPTTSIMAPCAFPAPQLDSGNILCGLGVPDARGTPGFWSIYRDDVARTRTTETGGIVVPLEWEDAEAGTFKPVRIDGPPNVMTDDPDDVAVTHIAARLDREGRAIVLDNGAEAVTVIEGRWSEPFVFRFRLNTWARVRATARFKVLSLKDPVKLYLEPLGLDPDELPRGVRLSHPENWAYELKERLGAFETVGWACATNPLKDGQIDEQTFLEDAQRVWDEQERLARDALQRRKTGLVTCIFTPPDRIQHMFARYEWTDVDRSGRPATPLLRGAVKAAYKRADHFVGQVLDALKPGEGLVVVSDHGFAPWRWAVNLNRFLADRGLLVLRQRTGGRQLAGYLETGRIFDEVDWSKTKAYSMGLGKIFINRKGREPHGIVDEAEAERLVARISQELRGLSHEQGEVVTSVARGRDIYDGDAIPEGAADLYVGFARGFRVSWHTCLGGADEPVIFENESAWSGDHCGVDPRWVPGVLAASFALKADDARVVDVAPTVISWFGVTPPAGGKLDGRSLLEGP